MRASVIVPTYYRPDDLSELFVSLLKQSVKPEEVIVVDDSPTSVIRHICEDYEARFNKVEVALVYVKNPRERSVTIARNLGVKMSKGGIVLFLDSDVVLYPDYVEKILDAFKKYPDALGVAGWTIFPPTPTKGVRFFLNQSLRKLFLLYHHAKDSCKYPEFPAILTKIVNCNWLSGTTMAVKRSVFNEFQFDENLKDYAYMEDILFSGAIYKKHPNKLFMTPYAKCIHKGSSAEGRKLRSRKLQNRKYVLMKLLGAKGLLMFGWQNFGILIFRFITKIRKWEEVIEE